MRTRVLSSLLVFGLSGCMTAPPTTDVDCFDAEATFGTSEGACFAPLDLPRCDGSAFEFYGAADGFADARFTVVTIAAGWCNPCRVEAAQMQERLVEAYADQGVRVVVPVVADNDFNEPTQSFCQDWVDQYTLTNPVLLDAASITQVYYPGSMLPATIIVDSEGRIRAREFGTSTGLETTRANLDRLLAEDG